MLRYAVSVIMHEQMISDMSSSVPMFTCSVLPSSFSKTLFYLGPGSKQREQI